MLWPPAAAGIRERAPKASEDRKPNTRDAWEAWTSNFVEETVLKGRDHQKIWRNAPIFLKSAEERAAGELHEAGIGNSA